MFRSSFLLFALLLSGTSHASRDNEICKVLDSPCQQMGNMLVIGASNDAEALLKVMNDAANEFLGLFGWEPPLTAVVPGGTISTSMRDQLAANQVSVQLPWLSSADKIRLRQSAIRRQVEAQTEGLPDAVRAKALQQAMAAISSNESNATHDGALAHELGHLWFMRMVPSSVDGSETGHAYGGFAPDWLDESFAVLLENSALRADRRQLFSELDSDQVIPLATFLSMTHPAANAAKALQAARPKAPEDSESQIIILTADEADEFLAAAGGDRAAHFYAQVQVFSDFLVETCGGASVYPSISTALQSGMSFDEWLAEQGQAFG
ncbi:MAG: hypothetical protein AAFN07_13795, partial [Pseudomonadota bacterium]